MGDLRERCLKNCSSAHWLWNKSNVFTSRFFFLSLSAGLAVGPAITAAAPLNFRHMIQWACVYVYVCTCVVAVPLRQVSVSLLPIISCFASFAREMAAASSSLCAGKERRERRSLLLISFQGNLILRSNIIYIPLLTTAISENERKRGTQRPKAHKSLSL